MNSCDKCDDSGVWLATELNNQMTIEKCDLCNEFETDQDAQAHVESLVYKKAG